MQQRHIWLRVCLGLGVLLLVGALKAQAQTLEERVQRLETQLPAWIKILQLSGDLRLRYQEEVDVLAFDYNAMVVGGELGFAKIFGSVIPYIGLIGEYVNNIEISNADDGFLVGIKFGHRRIREQWQWQVQYSYRRLDRNAWPDIFPDSDFLNGETNARGHEFMVTYGVWKYVEVGIDYYHAMEIEGSRKQNLFQFDVVLKFP